MFANLKLMVLWDLLKILLQTCSNNDIYWSKVLKEIYSILSSYFAFSTKTFFRFDLGKQISPSTSFNDSKRLGTCLEKGFSESSRCMKITQYPAWRKYLKLNLLKILLHKTDSALAAPRVPAEKLSMKRTVFFSSGTCVPPLYCTI